MSQFGVEPDRVTINSQIDDAITQGSPGEAIKTFEQALDGVSGALQNLGHECVYLAAPDSLVTSHHVVQFLREQIVCTVEDYLVFIQTPVQHR